MDSLISVIIPYYKDHKYLLRCLNAIRRQTYKNVEILLVLNEQQDEVNYDVKVIRGIGESIYTGLNKAVYEAKGEYIYFCTATSILRDNALEELYTEINNNGVDLSCISIYIPNGNDYKEYSERLSLFGKLYKKSLLGKDPFREDSVYCEYGYVAKYLTRCKGIRESSASSVYETDKMLLNEPEVKSFKIEAWQCLFDVIGTDFEKDGFACKLTEQESDKNCKEHYENKESKDTTTCLEVNDSQTNEIVTEDALKKILEQMNGDELIEYVLDKCRSGKLGLKTVVRSFLAWFKYKL